MIRTLAIVTLTCGLAACSDAAEPIPDDASFATSIRVLETLSADDMQGRGIGSIGSKKARAYLKSEIEKLDHLTPLPDQPVIRGFLQGANILALYDAAPDDTQPLLVMTAHFDHLGKLGEDIFNGADDNASGSGALFAVAESFKENPPEHDVLFAWLDGEELGLWGAFILARSDYISADRPIFNLNTDMVSQNVDGELVIAGTAHTPELRPLIEAIERPESITLDIGYDTPEDGWNDLTARSDHFAFHQRGLPWIKIGVGEHEHYHMPTDTFETIPLDQYRENLEFIVAVAQMLDVNLDTLAEKPEPIKAVSDKDTDDSNGKKGGAN